jgi:hypothetical protein
MAGGQRLISWLHPCSTSNVALNTCTCAHGPLMGHPNWARCDTEVDECGLVEIGNSKEETCGTQFRQVRAARYVIPYVLYAA